ncbi:g10952 [Coccomyxa viridis]|uniref:G10952 protein n=1 Tax=Coccomyxa viridis TaxID=1274662 RepID=A0ABP1G6N3_9CHLO
MPTSQRQTAMHQTRGSSVALQKVAELNERLEQRRRQALPKKVEAEPTRRSTQGRQTEVQPPWVSSTRRDRAAAHSERSTQRDAYRAPRRPQHQPSQCPPPPAQNLRPHAPANAPRRTCAPTPAAPRGLSHLSKGPVWAPAKKAPAVSLPKVELPESSTEEATWSIAAVRPQIITSPGTFRRGWALESGHSWWESEDSDSDSESACGKEKVSRKVSLKGITCAKASQAIKQAAQTKTAGQAQATPEEATLAVAISTSTPARSTPEAAGGNTAVRAAEESPAAADSARATQERVSTEIVAKDNVCELVAPAQQQSVKLAQQTAERPIALEVQQQKGVSLMATNPVYEEAEGAVQTPAAAEELTTVVENDAFVPTAPIQEDAGPAAPLSISSPSQVLPELALEQNDAQSGVEDEVEAAAPCAAELVRPLTAELKDCSALVVYQPALQGMSFAKAASAGTLLPLPYLGNPIRLNLNLKLPLDYLPLSTYEVAPAKGQLLLTYPVPEQRALVVYQPPLPAIGATSAKAASAGVVPLPYLGAVITISLRLMLFVDCLLLNGYVITTAKPQQRLTCPAPAAAPLPALAAAQDPAQEAEHAFNRLAGAMDAAWFGQAPSVPSSKPERHAEAAAASAPPSLQNQQGACREDKRGGVMGFLKALLRPCLGRNRN